MIIIVIIIIVTIVIMIIFNYKLGNGLCIPAVPPYTNIR